MKKSLAIISLLFGTFAYSQDFQLLRAKQPATIIVSKASGQQSEVLIDNLKALSENQGFLINQQVMQLQKEKEHKGGFGRGAWIGALIGFGTGALAGFISGNDDPNTFLSFTAGEKALAFGIGGGAGGAIIGGVIGLVTKKKKKSAESYNKRKANLMLKNENVFFNPQLNIKEHLVSLGVKINL